MAWREVQVIGHPTRSAIEHCSHTPSAHVEIQLQSDVLPPHTLYLAGMWFVVLSITGFDSTLDNVLLDDPDDPMTSVSFTGTITGTDIAVKLIFFGDVLDHFLVDLD